MVLAGETESWVHKACNSQEVDKEIKMEIKFSVVGKEESGYGIVIYKDKEEWFGTYKIYTSKEEAIKQMYDLSVGIVLELTEDD